MVVRRSIDRTRPGSAAPNCSTPAQRAGENSQVDVRKWEKKSDIGRLLAPGREVGAHHKHV
jgi:hypothetical protein